jgi:hypothetical protein
MRMDLMKRLTAFVSCVSMLLMSSGCATIFRGSSDSITVSSDQADAKIYVDGQFIGDGTGIVSVSKRGDHTIKVTKPGCKDRVIQTQSSFDPTTLLGLFLDFGLISILVVDGLATGNWMKVSPTYYAVTPDCPAKSASVR